MIVTVGGWPFVLLHELDYGRRTHVHPGLSSSIQSHGFTGNNVSGRNERKLVVVETAGLYSLGELIQWVCLPSSL